MSQISIKQKNSTFSIKNGGFGDYRCFLCLLHEVLCFKSKYRTQTISLIWIPFLSLGISLLLFLQFYRRRWGRSIGLCHRVKNKISQKDAKCIPSCGTAGIVFCAGESFGVLRLGTSPQISFSNDSLIKQFTTFRLSCDFLKYTLVAPPPPSPPEKKFSMRTVFTSLGTTKIPRINEKQRLCKFFPTVISTVCIAEGTGHYLWPGGGKDLGGITLFLGEQKRDQS